MPSQSSSSSQFIAPQGQFALQRLPARLPEPLQAWDSADVYLLNEFASANVCPEARVLIVNDSFGALALALHHYAPWAVSDSYLSQQATRLNFARNHCPLNVQLHSSLDKLDGVFAWVLIKVPKTLALLEDQLIRLRAHIQPNTQILLAGMQKALPASLWALLERLLGATQTALAKKKAKLIKVTPRTPFAALTSPYPVYYPLENSPYVLANHANVFSRSSLDIGTRFFIQHLPTLPTALDIIDLGCGNGVVGLLAAEQHPNARLHFVDESFMAIASAQENFQRAFATTKTAQFYCNDGLNGFAPASADLILCNPPFHQGQSVGDYLALSFFKQARTVLRPNGQLWVIGNRHLNYHLSLKRLFNRVQLIASNSKFVILKVSQLQ